MARVKRWTRTSSSSSARTTSAAATAQRQIGWMDCWRKLLRCLYNRNCHLRSQLLLRSGPSSINPATQKRYAMSFPLVTVEDMVHAQVRNLSKAGPCLDHMIDGLDARIVLRVSSGALFIVAFLSFVCLSLSFNSSITSASTACMHQSDHRWVACKAWQQQPCTPTA